MATQATTDDGVKNTKHQFANLVKPFFTCYQQQSIWQRWKQGSGQVRTPQPIRTSLASATRWSKQGPSEDRSSQTTTTNKWWMSSMPHQPRWQQQQHQALGWCHNRQGRSNKQQQAQRHRHHSSQQPSGNNQQRRQHSQTCQWRQHHQHSKQEHHVRCQYLARAKFQMT